MTTLEYKTIELVDLEAVKANKYEIISKDEEHKNSESSDSLKSNDIPILSWKNLTVVSTNPLYKAVSTLNEDIFNTNYSFDLGGSKLIKEVSGQIQGGLWAILGASGSGKTTLLNALSQRLDILRMHRTGDLRINGKPYDSDYLKSFTGTVMQEDVLQPKFTVYETLYFHAAFRLATFTAEEREKRIDEVLTLLNIEHTRDVLIGDSRHKGVSGGERKRVSVGIELLNRPKILFLDEPTSGLDSTTSLSLVEVLRQISDSKQCSVITTIHQPQEKIFDLFNNIILLRNGEIVYQGHTQDAISYFKGFGYELSHDENPADYLVDIISKNSYDPVTGAAVALPFANSDDVQKKEFDITLGSERPAFPPRYPLAWHYQFRYLFHRDLLEIYRSLDRLFIGIAAEMICATFIGLSVWHNLENKTVNAEPRRTGLYFAVIHQGVISSFLGNLTFPLDRALFLRERQSGTYRVSAYFISKSSVECIAQVPQVLFFCIIVYYLYGLQDHPTRFVIFTSFQFLVNIGALALINAISCLCVSIELTTAVTAFSFEIYRLFAGFFIPPISQKQYPKYKFFSTTNAAKYGFIGSALNEFTGLKFKGCPHPPGACITNGDLITAKYGYNRFTMSQCAGYTIVIILFWRAIGYLALRFIKF